MLKVGIIGTGFGVKAHIPGFNSISGVKVEGIWSQDTSKAKKIATDHKIPKLFSSWKELVTSPEIDIVSIAVPCYLQPNIATLAIKNNKAVLCEKPLAANLTQASRLLRLVSHQKVPNAIDFELRYLPAFKKLYELLQKNTIGSLRSITINLTTGARADKNLPLTWSNYQRFGGGIVLNYASHIIDYVEWLCGSIKEVSAQLSVCKQYHSLPHPDAEDTASIQFKLENNTIGQIFITNVVYGGHGQRIDIYGENGTLTLWNKNLHDFANGFKLYKTIKDKTTEIILPPLPLNNIPKGSDGRFIPFQNLIADFIKGIKTNKTIAPSLANGLRVQKVLNAITQSNRKKRWVQIF